MPAKKITLDPADVLEWLLDRGYVEPTSSAEHPYRIAINEDDFMPYTITFLGKKLSDRFSKKKLRSVNRKVWRRELYKCFEEYQISYDGKGCRGNMHWEFEETVRKTVEKKLGIDLEVIDAEDTRGKTRGGRRWQSFWRALTKRHPEEVALAKFLDYFNRRMNHHGEDLRYTLMAHKRPSNDVKEVDLNRPTSD